MTTSKGVNNNDEWHTPKYVIEKVKNVYNGKIDLDPCSSELANERIKAKFYYTKENSCLDENHLWFGKVFMNPPYSKRLLQNILTKAVYEYEHKNISELIILTNSSTDSKWNQTLISGLQAYTLGRIKFRYPNGIEGNLPSRGQVFTYYGDNKLKFIQEFSKNNFCWFPNLKIGE